MLSDYTNDTLQLLNDPLQSFVSPTQLTRWINLARRMCAKRTGCVRRLITGQSAFGASAQPGFLLPNAAQPSMIPDAFPQPGSLPSSFAAPSAATGSDFNSDFNTDFGPQSFPVSGSSGTIGPFQQAVGSVQGPLQTIPGVERYPYVGFFNPQLQAQHAGCNRVLDAIALSVNWGGSIRPTLDWMPWDNLQAYMRSYAVRNMAYPSVWSVYNDGSQGEIWMWPVPSQAGEIELDASVEPSDLYTDNDFDVIPPGFRDAIPYAAAALVYLSTKRYADAQVMESLFATSLGIDRVAVDGGKSPSYYFSSF